MQDNKSRNTQMKLYDLMRNFFDRMAKLVDKGWTGEVTLKIQINDGGVRNAKIATESPLKDERCQE